MPGYLAFGVKPAAWQEPSMRMKENSNSRMDFFTHFAILLRAPASGVEDLEGMAGEHGRNIVISQVSQASTAVAALVDEFKDGPLRRLDVDAADEIKSARPTEVRRAILFEYRQRRNISDITSVEGSQAWLRQGSPKPASSDFSIEKCV